MEWLINRRRMMFYKKVPPVYMNFEDQRIWEICCYNWGDTELVTGEIASGSVTADGSALAYSDLVFASCRAISAHKLSDGSGLSAIAAATQDFKVEITITASEPFANQADDDVVVDIKQYANYTATTLSLLNITKADWMSNAVDGVCTVTISATTDCQYLAVGVLATNGITAEWSISALTGNRQPVGITEKQCRAVTGVGSRFKTGLTHKGFEEFQYFTKVTSTDNEAFGRSRITGTLILPSSLTYLHSYMFLYSDIHKIILSEGIETPTIPWYVFYYATFDILVFPSTISSIPNISSNSNARRRDIIINGDTVRPLGGQTWYNTGRPFYVYVKDELVDAYKAEESWAATFNVNNILPISEYVES